MVSCHYQNKNGVITVLLFCFLLLLLSSCVHKKREISQGHDQGKGQDYEEYLYLKERTKKNPGNMETYLYLGEACMMLGKSEEMEASYLTILKASPPAHPSFLSEAHRRLGLIYLESLRQDQSREELRIIEKTHPWERGIYDLDGHYWYWVHKDFRGFSTFMGEYVNPTCASIFVGAGNMQRAFGNLDKAENIYMAGNVFDVEDPFLRSCLGNLLSYKKRYDEAEKVLQKAISIDPELGYFQICLGNLKRDMGRFQEALTWYENALKIDRRSDEYAYAGIGEVCLIMAEKEKALPAVLAAAVILLFTLLLVLIVSGILYRLKKNKSTEVRKQFIKKAFLIFILILIGLEAAGFWVLNGNYFINKTLNPRNFYCQKAIKAFDKAIRINPYRKDLRVNYAKAFRCINRIKDAESEEAMADLLPEYDLHASLKFNHP